MSGGSFNYASVGDIGGPSEDHYELVDVARATPGCEAVADAAAAVLRDWAALDERWAKLRPVLKAIEWYRSGDLGEESIAKALAEYRERQHPPDDGDAGTAIKCDNPTDTREWYFEAPVNGLSSHDVVVEVDGKTMRASGCHVKIVVREVTYMDARKAALKASRGE